MKTAYSKLIKACKSAAGYPGHRWEVALVFSDDNSNRPFRPENYNQWDGDMALLSSYYGKIKPGTYLECWIHGKEELEDNVYIWIDSPTSARVQVCGGKDQKLVTLNPLTPKA